MAGSNLLAISGIDGKFNEFREIIAHCAIDFPIYEFAYTRSLSFHENLDAAKKMLMTNWLHPTIIVGWSIGAVLAAFIAPYTSARRIVLINAFFRRSRVLALRGIACTEDVCIASAPKAKGEYIIIHGLRDTKIPFTESECIAKFFQVCQSQVYFYENASHSLASFVADDLVNIIIHPQRN